VPASERRARRPALPLRPYLEPQNRRTRNRRISKWKYWLIVYKLLRFEIPCSIFDIQNTKHYKIISHDSESYEQDVIEKRIKRSGDKV
jgi:hypothetical protein